MLIDEIKSLPKQSGVYEYFDKDGHLLYVGKAKILKNRVRSYFSFTSKNSAANGSLPSNPKVSPRIAKMISEAVHLEYIVTPSESDALILENSFIKQLKPKYNILLRDDKTYPYIYIDLSEKFPRFKITRKVIKGTNIKYFGPYFKGSREILEALYYQFALVQKNGCLKSKKECIFYQIKRCKAPCTGKISSEEYVKIVNESIKFIKNPELLLPNLEILMQNYALGENFEEAAKIRDMINTIKDIEVRVEVDLARLEDFEVIAINSYANLVAVVRFSVRDGKISGSKCNIINFKNLTKDDFNDIYRQAILEIYPEGAPVGANKIYTYDDFEDKELVAKILENKHGRKFQINSPKIGEKRRICEIAFKNCEINIQKHLKTHDYGFLSELKDYFDLQNLPVNIEIFDNSHMFGNTPVGAMVCFKDGNFYKENYRHAHLKSNNDYDQMIEFLTLRVKRFDKISPPDLWVIDGGKALLDLAGQILKSVGVNVDVIAISKEKIDAKAHRAKGAAKDKIVTINGTFSLSTCDKKLQFFQKLRDEAHRFAISFHQKSKRKQDLTSSKLLKMGVSAGSLKKLIDFFGSFEKIYEADYDEIKNLTNKKTAEILFKNY
ncbi:excinuclease ABC subunit UvrC [Campylobacter hominis]|uniref:excinuclease ABC subunit UvrC n=1 Tax=Campylobacter hominis TaxID=76517 RepID=UPI00248C48BA|nr:excinuclease ABC subunit UvrC [Campylobacter hominis]